MKNVKDDINKQTRSFLLVANVSKEHIRKFHIPFIQYMKSKNWRVDVACRLDEQVPEADNAYNLPCDRNPFQGGIKESVACLVEIIKNNQYDAIICNTLTGGIIARLAKRQIGKKAPKLFYINHGLHFFEGAPLSRWILGYPMEKILVRFTDVIVCINKADYKMVKKHLRPKCIEKINGIGVDLERFRNCNLSIEDKMKLRASLGLEEKDFVLTYVAEINDNKNQKMLLEAFHVVNQMIPNAKMLLVGPAHDNGKLQKFSESRGLNGKVKFLGWRNDIPELLKLSDVYVASSQSEGLGINLIEAMACEIPVVASKNRGHAEIIRHEKNGFLVEQNDYEEMAKYVIELYENQDVRRKVVYLAKKNIAKFEINSVVQEEERIICSNL